MSHAPLSQASAAHDPAAPVAARPGALAAGASAPGGPAQSVASGTAHDAGIPHDDAATLIRMANQIATAFRLEPEDKAVPAMREHIGKFWTRAMRTRLNTLAAADTPDLDARIRRAFG
jgi:hypothetical protein